MAVCIAGLPASSSKSRALKSFKSPKVPELTPERRPPLLSKVASSPLSSPEYFFLQHLQHGNGGYFTLQRVPTHLNFLQKITFLKNLTTSADNYYRDYDTYSMREW